MMVILYADFHIFTYKNGFISHNPRNQVYALVLVRISECDLKTRWIIFYIKR